MAFGIPQAVRSAEDQMAMDGVMDRTVTKMDRSCFGMTGIVDKLQLYLHQLPQQEHLPQHRVVVLMTEFGTRREAR